MASLTYELTLAGLAVGSAAALTGIGLIVTYRATGVLNLAHGAIAMVCAYELRQFVVEWGWPLWLGTAVTLLVVAPGIGVVLDRAVFRPLALTGSDPTQTLVASIGVFVLLVGGAALVWGTGARDDAPVLLGDDPWVQLGTVVLLACLVGAVTRWSAFGRELRAVVDNRPLAVLGGIDADRVAAVGWAFGSFTAGLTGALLAPYVRLDPYGMPLLVVEVIAVAVVARMRSLPVAIGTALLIGVAQAQLTRLHPEGWAGPLVQAVGANLFVVALLVAALLLPGMGARDSLPPPAAPGRTPVGVWPVVAVLFLLPLGFAGSDLRTSIQVPALAIVLLSLVVVTGRGGQIALGQAAYAGLGALFTGLLTGAGLPGLVALGVAVPLVAVAGLLTGWPAIRRRGLALALATLAVGVAVSRFVFAQPYATAGLSLDRPAGFAHDRGYYALELALLAGCLLVVAALRRGRAGRALAALRDHEAGAEAAGVPVSRLKLLAFVLGAALAALGGGLLGMSLRAFDPEAYDPIRALLWFAAIVVLGADSLLSPLVAAALLVALDAGPRGGLAAALIGILATLISRVPPLTTWLTRATAGPEGRAAPGGGAAGRGAPSGPTGPPVRRGAAAGPRDRPGTAAGGTAGDAATGHAAPGDAAGPTVPRGTAAGPRDRHGAAAETAGPTGTADDDTARGSTAAGEVAGRKAAGGAAGSTAAGAVAGSKAAGGAAGGAAGTTAVGGAAGSTAADGAAGATAAGEVAGRKAAGGAAGGTAGPPVPRRTGAGGGAPAPAGTGDEDHAPTPAEGGPAPAAGGGRARGAGPGPGGGAGRVATAEPVPRLRAVGLRVVHPGGVTGLDDVGIELVPGRVTAVVGANGAGKSTLFDCLAGSLRPRSGRVLLDGVDITRRPAHARTRLGIGRTFQQLAVFPSLTVEENVRVGAEQGGGPGSGSGPTDAALRLLGLAGPVRRLPAAGLPTGTLRRVELARALAARPHTLLLDEPAAGLDSAETDALARLLSALAADGLAVLVVEHDPDLVAGIAHTVHTMEGGRIVS
ncbi:ABC transporter permease subunit [Streptomyces solicathayae]|uniref:ATP-binding cassette domain-containing protein n=1 Tax=Streptomyces solicathayae TaxID=3081768 RepID=A0ABZ0M0N2_9ACTN|nr:ATP-binding cassette domain-containing protein [Streptomyces sp. HUAS YS2]WOX25233.1 ATP-binding cassette domain-containing protein [Streptomyces sp. HUAS YS2]